MEKIEFAEHKNGVKWAYFPALAQLGLRHGISTRFGGVSCGGLASLNLGVKVGDAPENIAINRRNFAEALGVADERIVASGQVHETMVAIVTNIHAGQRIAATDGLVTNTPKLPLLLFFADCVPLLIYDPVRKAIGLSHAGWKGTLHSIGPKTIATMQQAFDTDPADCIVGIAPSIGPDDYEVDQPVFDEISKLWPLSEQFCRPARQGHWLLDLWRWNQLQFIKAGVKIENIHISGISTARQPELFFSHRASQGKAGRFGVLMTL
jgi:YfiH family protein